MRAATILLRRSSPVLLLLTLTAGIPLAAQDWSNYGGHAQRNGQSAVIGPVAADALWDNDDDFSIIAWFGGVKNGLVFAFRSSNQKPGPIVVPRCTRTAATPRRAPPSAMPAPTPRATPPRPPC